MYTHENATRTHSDREDRTLLCEIAPSITINPIRPGLRASHAAQYLARISHASRTHASRTHATRPNIAACHLISSRSHRAAGPLGPPSQRITPCRYPLFLGSAPRTAAAHAPRPAPRARVPARRGCIKTRPRIFGPTARDARSRSGATLSLSLPLPLTRPTPRCGRALKHALRAPAARAAAAEPAALEGRSA